jgi:hypothetical protein
LSIFSNSSVIGCSNDGWITEKILKCTKPYNEGKVWRWDEVLDQEITEDQRLLQAKHEQCRDQGQIKAPRCMTVNWKRK